MHRYLASLEKRVKDKTIRSFLFNKYYTIVGLYWSLFYTFWFSAFVGIGNALFSETEFLSLFLQGFFNNVPLSFAVNLVYARLVMWLCLTKYPRIYSQLLNVFVQTMFFVWHGFRGTEHPLQAILPAAIIGVILSYYHVSKIVKR